MPFVKEGTLVALASGSIQRSQALPDVPTTEEPGIANSAYGFWVGNRRTRVNAARHDIIDRLHVETVNNNKALNSPEIQKLWESLGQDFHILPPGEFDAYLRREAASNSSLIKAANIKVN